MSHITEFYFYKLHFMNYILRKFFFFRVIVHLKYNFFLYLYSIYSFLIMFNLKNFFFFNYRFIYRRLKYTFKTKKLYKKSNFFFLFRRERVVLKMVLRPKIFRLYLFFFFKFFVFFKWLRFFASYTMIRHGLSIRKFRNIKYFFLQFKKRRISFFIYLFTIISKHFLYYTWNKNYLFQKKKKFYYFTRIKKIKVLSLSFLNKPFIKYLGIKISEKIQIPFFFKIVKKKINENRLLFVRRSRILHYQWLKNKLINYKDKRQFFFYYTPRNFSQYYSNVLSYLTRRYYNISDREHVLNIMNYKLKLQSRVLSKRFIKLNKFLLKLKHLKKKKVRRLMKKYFKNVHFLFAVSRVYWKLQIYLKQLKYHSIFYSQLYYFYKLRKSIKCKNNCIKNNQKIFKKEDLIEKKQLKFFINKNNYLIDKSIQFKNYLFVKSKIRSIRRLIFFLNYITRRYSFKSLYNLFKFLFTLRFVYPIMLNDYFTTIMCRFSKKQRIRFLTKGLKKHFKYRKKSSKYNQFLTKSNVLYGTLLSTHCYKYLIKRCFRLKRQRLSWLFLSQVSNFFFSTFLSNVVFTINFALNASISKFFIRKAFFKLLSFRPPKGNLLFLKELVNIFIISSAAKDSKILHDWIIRNLTLVFYRKHRQFIGFLKKTLMYMYAKLRRKFKIRGFLITFRGKIGQVGSVRKKAFFLRRGIQSLSNLNIRINSSTGAVTTATGSIGVSVSLFY